MRGPKPGTCPRCGNERSTAQVSVQARPLVGGSLGRRCKSLCEMCAAEMFSALADVWDREIGPLVDGPYARSLHA